MKRPNWLVIALLVLAALAAAVAVFSARPREVPAEYRFDASGLEKVPAILMGYREAAPWPVNLRGPRALAIGPHDRVYVAGQKAVRIFDAQGAVLRDLPCAAEPACLGVGPDGSLVAATITEVRWLGENGTPGRTWRIPGENAHVTCVALAQGQVLIADWGSRAILVYDLEGRLLRRIDGKSPQQPRGFLIPSPFFDVASLAAGKIMIADTALHRLETYSAEGVLVGHWGALSNKIDGFTGCCNPAHFTVLPDQRIATLEKGVPRVKIYDPQGRLLTVVAAPESFAPPSHPIGLAADSRGRVLILDEGLGTVRVFEPKDPPEN